MSDLLPAKSEVIKSFIEKFSQEVAEQSASAMAAHHAATHEESKAEDRHDTFAIEASYLAAGQSARILSLQAVIAEFRAYLEGASQKHVQVGPGSLVKLHSAGRDSLQFFARSGGGQMIKLNAHEISVVTSLSQLGLELENARAGDTLEVESKGGIKNYSVVQLD